MTSVGSLMCFLYSVMLMVPMVTGSPSGYGHSHGHGRAVRRRIVVIREPEHHHVSHEMRHASRPRYHHEGSVSIVRESRPDVVVVDHGGHGYLPAEPVHVVSAPAVVPAVVQAPVVPVAPAQPAPSGIDPR